MRLVLHGLWDKLHLVNVVFWGEGWMSLTYYRDILYFRELHHITNIIKSYLRNSKRIYPHHQSNHTEYHAEKVHTVVGKVICSIAVTRWRFIPVIKKFIWSQLASSNSKIRKKHCSVSSFSLLIHFSKSKLNGSGLKSVIEINVKN